MTYQEIDNQEKLMTLLSQEGKIEFQVFQNIDFDIVSSNLETQNISNCIFMGCKLNASLQHLFSIENLIFPTIDAPFNVYISSLYNKEKLYGNYILGNPASFQLTFDQKIYSHYIESNLHKKNIKEMLARRIHDHSITDALNDLLANYSENKVVAIMGGHKVKRNEKRFFDIALLSKKLTENGYLMVSGGGPGAMEATHVGAWFGGKEDNVLKEVCNTLAEAPDYKHPLWLDKSMEVLSIYPTSEFESISIPTWHYGHEPSTPFASHIAKYFENSIREDGLLTIAKGGIIFTPGSAGTMQEIFQEAVQNHYLSFGYASPMIFFDKKYWTEEIPVYDFIKQLKDTGKYQNLILSIYDTNQEVIAELDKFTNI